MHRPTFVIVLTSLKIKLPYVIELNSRQLFGQMEERDAAPDELKNEHETK